MTLEAAQAQLQAALLNADLTPKQQKAIALIQAITNVAMDIAKAAPQAFPPKRIFQTKERRPLKCIAKKQALARMYRAPIMGRVEVMKIMQTPTFPQGAYESGGIVGETGPELVTDRIKGTLFIPSKHLTISDIINRKKF